VKLGIVGLGRMGKLLCKNLSQDFDVLAFDIEDKGQIMGQLGGEFSTLEKVCTCPIVIPAVPISHFESTIKSMAPHLKDKSLVIDICSVKEYPMKIMAKNLSSSIYIMGTHPMFGPDSASDTLFGNKMVVCRGNTPDQLYSDIIHYLERYGIKVIQTTPEKHDREISHSLLLTHFLGRTLMDLNITPLEIDTKGYRRLMKILGTVENDTWQLFEDMNKYNAYSKETRENFIRSLNKVNGNLNK